MKILFVIDQYDNYNNGTTMSAVRFVEGLRKSGNEVRIISTGKEDKDKYIVKEIILTPIVSHIVKSQGMCFAVPNEKALREAISWADVVHFYMPFWLSKKGVKIAKELKVPHTAAFHVQPENITYTLHLGKNGKVNDCIYNYFNKSFYNQFTHIHCPSNFIANELKNHNYTAKLHVISNGVDDDFHFRKVDKSSSEPYIITMIGRYSNEKRQDVLIDAIYHSKYKDSIQLVLAGKGLNENQYKKQGANLKYQPILKFYNKQDLLELLSKTDLYVHSADAEIEAISCIEAFACGNVPIIANSKKSATPQFALDERSLFEAGNSLDLAKKIDYWLDNINERKQMEIKYAESAEKYRLSHSIKLMEEMLHESIVENT